MEREKLIQEHKATLESLIEKTMFVYSEEYYSLNEFEKQKYTKDKMATESHLNTLSALLWANTPQIGGISDMLMFGLLSSMFGSSSSFNTQPLPTFTEIKDENNAV